MRFTDKTISSLHNLTASPGRSLIMAFVTAFACGFLFLIFSFCNSFRSLVVDRMLKTFPANMIEVRRKPEPFPNKDAESTVRLDQGSIKPLACMSCVRKVYLEEILRVPSVTVLSLMVFKIAFESPIYGISEAYVRGELEDPSAFAWSKKPGALPVIISEELLEVFNASYIAPRGMRPMSRKDLRKLEIELTVGRSVLPVNNYADPLTLPLSILTTSRKVERIGLNVPLRYVVEWNRKYLGKRYEEQLTRAVIEADSPSGAEAVAQEAEAMGFAVVTGREAVRRLIVVQNAILASGSLLAAAVLVLAAVAVGCLMILSVSEQRNWIGLQRALGARRSDIYHCILLEALVLAVISNTLGIGISSLFAGGFNSYMLGRIPRFSFVPEQFFKPDLTVALLCWAGMCLFCALAAFPAARRAAKQTPIEALMS